jgi:hypothetical protein
MQVSFAGPNVLTNHIVTGLVPEALSFRRWVGSLITPECKYGAGSGMPVTSQLSLRRYRTLATPIARLVDEENNDLFSKLKIVNRPKPAAAGTQLGAKATK